MGSRLNDLLVLMAIGLLALAAGCGDDQSNGVTPSSSPPVTSTSTPAATLGERVTFYAARPGDGAGAIQAGDFNGDTVPDVVLAASRADSFQDARPDAGEAYVFLGPFTAGEARDSGAGQYDMIVYGARAGDQLGHAIAVGDFNGDGIDDIALGAPFSDGPDLNRANAGQVYILLGSRALGNPGQEVDLATGGGEVTVPGADAGDMAGFTLDAADIDGDARADLIIGAFLADGPGNQRPDAGEVYVLYGGGGRETVEPARDQQDLTVYGGEADDRLGEAIGAGDVNGDGLADLILAATFADGPDSSRDRAGETYVILAPPDQQVDAARGEQDLTVFGIDPGDQIGHAIASGDANGNGFDDVLLGAVSADGPANGADLAGEAYLIPGSDSVPQAIDVSVGGSVALIYGASAKARLGRSAAMGDVNGDGLSDLLIAAPDVPVDDGPEVRAGAVYIFYGRQAGPYPSVSDQADITVLGLNGGDILGHEAFGTPSLTAADMDGDGLAEILVSAPQADGPEERRPDAGEAYIIFMEKPGDLSVGRPASPQVLGGVIGELKEPFAVPPNDVYVEVPGPVGGEGDPLAIRGPRGANVLARVVGHPAEVLAVHIHDVDLVVPVTVGDEGNSRAIRGHRRIGAVSVGLTEDHADVGPVSVGGTYLESLGRAIGAAENHALPVRQPTSRKAAGALDLRAGRMDARQQRPQVAQVRVCYPEEPFTL